MPALYGAGIEGVRALLPHRVIDALSEPTETQVLTWIEEGSGRVFARVGSLTVLPNDPVEELGDLSIRAWGLLAAKHASELYAAGMTEASGAPELARPNDTTSYAAWLMAQYEAAVLELIELIDRNAGGDGVPPEDAALVDGGAIAYAFPPVTFPDDMRF